MPKTGSTSAAIHNLSTESSGRGQAEQRSAQFLEYDFCFCNALARLLVLEGYSTRQCFRPRRFWYEFAEQPADVVIINLSHEETVRALAFRISMQFPETLTIGLLDADDRTTFDGIHSTVRNLRVLRKPVDASMILDVIEAASHAHA
ncbi:hypothetical protein [Pelagibacterium montanilacus]|uniref:hypothetical protein n=1 Tax=Pelagibacterium montanilacus TaxID=2185280 RepID=UPI000F8EE688|nr:hypothetical protein [Pelagibacterium montanilacus]